MTLTPGAPGSVLEAPCRAIAEATRDLLSWEFDPRFRAAMAAFPALDQHRVLTALEQGFEGHWNRKQLGQAPPRAVELAGKTGGLRDGQLLLATNAESDPILFGLWWPWGGGQTISIRVLFSARTLDEAQKAELLATFQGWFGL